MKTVNQSDPRFVTITGGKIRNLFRKIPKQFGGYLIQMYYKDTEDDFIGKHMDVEIDQRTFPDDFTKLVKKEVERIYFTHGMTDIDMFFREDKLVIYWSPSDGTYVYFEIEKEEWENIINWIKLENKNND